MLLIICCLNETHLPNFIGHKNTYTVFMSLDNIYSEICYWPSKMVVVLLALLLVKTKLICESSDADETSPIY